MDYTEALIKEQRRLSKFGSAKVNKRQRWVTENGITFNICNICQEKIRYGDGVYSKGIEYHKECLNMVNND